MFGHEGVVFRTFDCIIFGYRGGRVFRAVRVIFQNWGKGVLNVLICFRM